MLCLELEELEAKFDDIVSALEKTDLTEEQRRKLKEDYEWMIRQIDRHRARGHDGGPCFEE